MKIFRIIALTLLLALTATSTVGAMEISKQPLDEVFDRIVIVPYDYQGKVFINGRKTDIDGEYRLYQRNGRVLVPVRLMGQLVAYLDEGYSYWDVIWEANKPDEVLLINHNLDKTVQLKVNDKTIYVNKQPKTIDVAPQNIDGRVVLPLRAIAEALDKRIEWLDGLVLISNEYIDLQSPRTLKIVDNIKDKLKDERRQIAAENKLLPVGKFGETIYYLKENFVNDKYVLNLYKKVANGSEVKVDLPGEENLYQRYIIENGLYYASVVEGQSALYRYDLLTGRPERICALQEWSPDDGWLGGVKNIDDKLYVLLHRGDLTMGYDTIYSLENGDLKEVAGGKSILKWDIRDNEFYYPDFNFMGNPTNNLYKVNLASGEEENLGDQTYTYGIFRDVAPDGSVSYSGGEAFYLAGDYIYTLGYQDADQEDKPAVYKISTSGRDHWKLTGPVKTFWLVDDEIYYLDLATGYLVKTDLEGQKQEILIEQPVSAAEFTEDSIYYTVSTSDAGDTLGKLYKYNQSDGKTEQLSKQTVSQFWVDNSGVYYISEGYDLGLYKVGVKGENTCLVADSVDLIELTKDGLVYTLRYQEGIYTAK